MGGILSSFTLSPNDPYSHAPNSFPTHKGSDEIRSSRNSANPKMSSSDIKIPQSDILAKPTDQPSKTNFPLKEKPEVAARPSEKIHSSREEGEEGQDREGREEDEQEEGECGFCLFMKAGGCKDCFVAWEQCIEECEKNTEDIVEKCFKVTGDLKKCMEAHADYYEPILKAEKVVEEEAIKELEKEALGSQDSEQARVSADKQDGDS